MEVSPWQFKAEPCHGHGRGTMSIRVVIVPPGMKRPDTRPCDAVGIEYACSHKPPSYRSGLQWNTPAKLGSRRTTAKIGDPSGCPSSRRDPFAVDQEVREVCGRILAVFADPYRRRWPRSWRRRTSSGAALSRPRRSWRVATGGNSHGPPARGACSSTARGQSPGRPADSRPPASRAGTMRGQTSPGDRTARLGHLHLEVRARCRDDPCASHFRNAATAAIPFEGQLLIIGAVLPTIVDRGLTRRSRRCDGGPQHARGYRRP